MKLPLVFLAAAALGAVGCAGNTANSPLTGAPVFTTSAPVATANGATTASPASASPASAPASDAQVAQAAVPSSAPPAEPAQPVAKRDDSPSPSMARDYGWISIGIGAFAGAIALGTSGVMIHDMSVRSSGCPNKVCSQDGLNANEDIKTLIAPNAVAWGVAVVGIGLGAFLLITHPAEKKQETAIGIAPTGSGTGLTLRSTF